MAKQAATIDQMTGGRHVLGLGVDTRDDDYAAAGADMRTRGRRLDEQLAVMRRLWSGEPYGGGFGPIGPLPARPGGPEVLLGGFRPAALERVARWGDGYLAAAPVPMVADLFGTVRKVWQEHGRDGEPRLVAQVNVALGPQDVIDQARTALLSYYAFTGMADRLAEGMLTTPAGIRSAINSLTRSRGRRDHAPLLRPRPGPGGPARRHPVRRRPNTRHGQRPLAQPDLCWAIRREDRSAGLAPVAPFARKLVIVR
ncbi:LLM class flavin-dependent oxidoreductase [Streptomyces sp. NPDC001307]|uniref:LLM class flavin-dependent oxidoreductase n=1 Tax=Streptomyces sp. NPDC001307 TaxID=3364560 RepID=UPI0036808DBE